MAPTVSTTQLSYTLAGLLAPTPHRLDGRGLLAFRPLQLATGLAPQAAGSAQATLGSSTCCTAVVSAEVVHDDEASDVRGLLSCSVDCAAAVPSSTSLAALLVTLQKALGNALQCGQQTGKERQSAPLGVDPSQLVILRHIQAPHRPTRAWRLHIDVEFNDVSGGNLADTMFAAVYAALNDTRLPRTRAIGLDVSMLSYDMEGQNLGQDGTTDGMTGKSTLDIFATKGTRDRGKAGGGVKARRQGAGTTESALNGQLGNLPSNVGVDFEIEDQYESGKPLEGAEAFPLGITLNLLPDNRTLLDATLQEEACLPTSRRVFVLCKPGDKGSGKSPVIAGTYTLGATLDVGSSRTGEADDEVPVAGTKATAERQGSSRGFYGTCAYASILAAIREGAEHAQGLHAAVRAQLPPTKSQSQS